MEAKRKISVRKILQVFLTIVVSTGCIIAIVSASRIEDRKMLTSVAVHIRNDKKYHFIEEKEIMDLAINNRGIDIEHTPAANLDLRTMEQVITSDPWVASAQVYIDNDRVLQMYVTQRVPVARLFFQQESKSCYMDGTLSLMPLSESYVYYTTVVTNVPELTDDSAGWAMKKQIAKVVNTIQADTFWSVQVSQVIADTAGTFELMPVLGDQKILMGDTSRIREKLDNLFVFYKNVLNRIGWDRYETLDLRFKGQVVASPSIPYTGPEDKAVKNMNWINSIIETEAKNDMDSTAVAAPKTTTAPVASAAPKKADKPVVKEKPKPKIVARPVAKKTVKAPEKKAQAHNAPPQKAKPAGHDKEKDNSKEKNKKPATPKYVYPENKGH